MMPSRHNLSRRAVLGAGVGACVARDSHLLTVPPVQGAVRDCHSLTVPSVQGAELASEPSTAAGDSQQVTVPFYRTLAAYRRAEARIAAFKEAERALPPARRDYPACEDLEERFGDFDSGACPERLRCRQSKGLNLLRRLLRTPAPDLAALALKLELAVADQAWELAGAETCLPTLAADARRLASSSSG